MQPRAGETPHPHLQNNLNQLTRQMRDMGDYQEHKNPQAKDLTDQEDRMFQMSRKNDQLQRQVTYLQESHYVPKPRERWGRQHKQEYQVGLSMLDQYNQEVEHSKLDRSHRSHQGIRQEDRRMRTEGDERRSSRLERTGSRLIDFNQNSYGTDSHSQALLIRQQTEEMLQRQQQQDMLIRQQERLQFQQLMDQQSLRHSQQSLKYSQPQGKTRRSKARLSESSSSTDSLAVQTKELIKKVQQQNEVITKLAVSLDHEKAERVREHEQRLLQREHQLRQQEQQYLTQMNVPPYASPFMINQQPTQSPFQQQNTQQYGNQPLDNWMQNQQFHNQMLKQQHMTNLMAPLGQGMPQKDILKSVGLIKHDPYGGYLQPGGYSNGPDGPSNGHYASSGNLPAYNGYPGGAPKKKKKKRKEKKEKTPIKEEQAVPETPGMKYKGVFRRCLRQIGIVQWYFRRLKSIFVSRFETYQASSSQQIGKVLSLTQTWLLTQGFQQADALLYGDPKLKLELTGPKKLSAKENLKRIEAVLKISKTYVDDLLGLANKESMGEELAQLLGEWTHDYEFPPQRFLFQFEVERLSFSSFGQLVEMKPWKRMLVLGCLSIIRHLLHKRLLRPSQLTPPRETSPLQHLNAKTIASVLYHAFMELLSQEVPRQFDNQLHVDIDFLCKSKSGCLDAEDNVEQQQEEEGPPEDTLIQGLFSKSQLQDVFIDHKDRVENIKALLNCFMTEVDELVQTSYKKKTWDMP